VRTLSLVALLALLPVAPAAEAFALRDGDRVVWLGSTLIEREQRSGWWELALTTRFAGKNVTFRNLGWSGDTVFGDAHVGFAYTRTGTANVATGFRHLIDHTLSLRPTVLLIAYGTNESFAGPEGLPRFVKGLDTLLDTLAPAKARVVLLSPLRQGTMPAPLPDPAKANRNLRLYADAIRDVAKRRGLGFVDLYDLLGDIGKVEPAVTDNGIHLTEAGYRWSAPLLEKGLGLAGQPAATEHREKLRRAIVAKNELYFHRWRPQNETYLFGFRKHGQGKNAREVPQFDPLIEAKEKEIAALALPRKHTYELKKK
jgi:lysophospholipase L1-like esterase